MRKTIVLLLAMALVSLCSAESSAAVADEAKAAVETEATAEPQTEAKPEAKPAVKQESVSASSYEDDAEPATPVDLSGYFSLRYFNDTTSGGFGSFQQHAASFFIGKRMGKWRFFSEVEFEYAPVFNAANNQFSTARGEVLIETAWLSYTHRDWLQTTAGLLLMPTWWRIHHYPSTTLTVNSPLIDKQIFPADMVGVMIHGNRYGEEGGVGYRFFMANGRGPDHGRRDADDHKAAGGTFTVRVPTGRFFRTFDVGVQLYNDKLSPFQGENIYGFETLIEKGRMTVLGEFAHANIKQRGGSRTFFREGYYVQPSYQIVPKLHLVYRYDMLNFDSRTFHSRDWRRHTGGVTYRPSPLVALKAELAHYRPENRAGRQYVGMALGVAFFFQ